MSEFKVGDKVIDSNSQILTIERETKLYWILNTGHKVHKSNNRFVGNSIWYVNDIHVYTEAEAQVIKERRHKKQLLSKIRLMTDKLDSNNCSVEYLEGIYNSLTKDRT